MHKNLINIIIVLLVGLSFSCDDPLPIELTSEEDNVVIDVVNPETDSYVITGYDSTGITDAVPLQKSVISLSGIKNTINNVTLYKGYGEAVFYDTTKPVYSEENNLIGYETLDFGSVSFDNNDAEVLPYRLKYRENLIVKDTLVGVKHAFSYRTVLLPALYDFPYNESVVVKFINQNNSPTLLSVKLPQEIKGELNISGKAEDKSLEVSLSWNQGNSTESSDEIIVGGIISTRSELVPLFRLSQLKSNRFDISNSLIKDILNSGEYDFIVVSFIRKIRKSSSASRLGDLYFASQSIHNIWIKI